MANPLSGGGLNRRHQCNTSQGHSGFAESCWRKIAADKMDPGVWHFLHTQQGKCINMALIHSAMDESDTIFESGSQSEDDPAGDLINDNTGRDHAPAILGTVVLADTKDMLSTP